MENIFRTLPPPKNSCYLEMSVQQWQIQDLFPLKKNPGSATAVWIKIILNITKLIELIFLQRIKTSLKGTSRNLYQIFQFRLSEVYLLLVLFPLNLPCQTGSCLGVGGSIFFLDCVSILYTIYEIIASSSWDLPTCKLQKK